MTVEDPIMQLLSIVREESKNHTEAVRELAVEYGKNNTLLRQVGDQYEKVRKSLHEQNNLKQKEIELKSQELELNFQKIKGESEGIKEKWRTLKLIFEKPKDFMWFFFFLLVVFLLVLNLLGVEDNGLTGKIVDKVLP